MNSVNCTQRHLLFLFYFYILVFGLYVCLCTKYVSGAHNNEKKVSKSGLLGLESQMVVSYQVGPGNEPVFSIRVPCVLATELWLQALFAVLITEF